MLGKAPCAQLSAEILAHHSIMVLEGKESGVWGLVLVPVFVVWYAVLRVLVSLAAVAVAIATLPMWPWSRRVCHGCRE